jgi:hypothetical protein
MRLEALDALEDMRVPQWPRPRATAGAPAASLTKHHPIWLLVSKELRVQQLALVVAGLYLFGWLGIRLLLGSVYGDLYSALSAVYAPLLAILIGSVASAEERQLGTIEWQVLLPVATSTQWIVKCGVVLGLTALLAIGLPVALAHLSSAVGPRWVLSPGFGSVVLLLAAGSLYISSLCASGAFALVMSLPITLGAVLFNVVALDPVATVARQAWSRLYYLWTPSGARLGELARWRAFDVLDLLLIACFIALVARLAMVNHRFADRSARRVWKHAILMAAFATCRVIILSGMALFVGRRW